MGVRAGPSLQRTTTPGQKEKQRILQRIVDIYVPPYMHARHGSSTAQQQQQVDELLVRAFVRLGKKERESIYTLSERV